jgi:hypothetical protein
MMLQCTDLKADGGVPVFLPKYLLQLAELAVTVERSNRMLARESDSYGGSYLLTDTPFIGDTVDPPVEVKLPPPEKSLSDMDILLDAVDMIDALSCRARLPDALMCRAWLDGVAVTSVKQSRHPYAETGSSYSEDGRILFDGAASIKIYFDYRSSVDSGAQLEIISDSGEHSIVLPGGVNWFLLKRNIGGLSIDKGSLLVQGSAVRWKWSVTAAPEDQSKSWG